MADYFVANCRTDLGETGVALASIDAQLATAPSDYRALRGQLLWQKGTASSRSGLVYEALESYRESLALFENMKEEINASYMRAGVIAMYSTLGRDGEAWRERVRAFGDVSRIGHPRVLQTALETTARAEATAGRWDTASAFFGLSLEPDLQPPNPVVRADASVWRSLMTHRLGWHAVANEEIIRARRAVLELKDPAIRRLWRSRLSIAEALTIKEDDPHRALEKLSRSLVVARAQNDVFDIPEILLERGRLWRSLGDEGRAAADFEEALATSRTRDRSGPDLEIRNSYFAVDESAAEELVDLLDRKGDGEGLVAAADHSRARSFGTPQDADVRSMRRGIPPGTLLVQFTSLRDRLLVAEIDGRGVTVNRVPVARDVLRSRVAQFSEEITSGDETSALVSARHLYDILLGRMHSRLEQVDRLVIVPDDVVAAVPFAALRLPEGRFLIENTVLIHAPSATVFAQSKAKRPSVPPGTLAVGNPRFNRFLWPRLPMLPAAEREAAEMGRIYPNAHVLIGADATVERVVASMKSHSIVDLACHAVVDSRDPSRSVLILAATPHDPGSLYLGDVARLSLDAHVVVLAACRTTASTKHAPTAMRSFALAFLAAGASNAVGALWDLDDEAAHHLSTSFHSRLRDGIAPAEALRLTQLSMLRSGRPDLSALRSWAGFQLFGAGT
jgi:CHAT domain-containing protein